MSKITKQTISHIAKLSNIPVTEEETENLRDAFAETLETISNLQTADISKTEPTHQVTGLTNVLREDEVDAEHMLSQEEALANAPETHNGYFVVPQIIEEN